jgi:hypothetical protein
MYGGKGPTGNWSGDKTPKGYKTTQLQQFTPEQLELFQQQFSHLGPDSYLSKLAGGDQSQFSEMEEPAMRQFNELQGGLASRFSGIGMGSRKSSGFQNASTAAAGNFASDLASKRNDYRQQAINDLMGLSNTLLNQRPYDRSLVEKPLSGWQQAGIGFAGGLGQGIGNAAGKFASGGF